MLIGSASASLGRHIAPAPAMSWSTSRRAPSRLTPFAAAAASSRSRSGPSPATKPRTVGILPPRRAGGLDEEVHALLRAEGGHAQDAEAVARSSSDERSTPSTSRANTPFGTTSIRPLRVAERLERRHLAPGHGHDVVDRARHQPGEGALVRARAARAGRSGVSGVCSL